MSDIESNDLRCRCGKAFHQQNALSNHRRVCPRAKAEAASALQNAKVVWLEKQEALRIKKQKRAVDSHRTVEGASLDRQPDRLYDSLLPPPQVSEQPPDNVEGPLTSEILPFDEETLNIPIAQRRTERKRQLPARYRDLVPQPFAVLPSAAWIHREDEAGVQSLERCVETATNRPSDDQRRESPTLCSPSNAFGLFRKYYSESFPTHDPDEEIGVEDMSDISNYDDAPTHAIQDLAKQNDFAPYPNKSAYLLSDWYWQTGTQKSRDNFQKLVDIITSDGFSIEDITDVPWNKLNAMTGSPGTDNTTLHSLAADWKEKEVRITVPFRRTSMCTGPQEFVLGKFWCRSILSILREKVTGPDGRYFHYEPYELYWQPGGNASLNPPIQVYGELYSSPAFLQAHRELQLSPPEKGCTLPRVIAALMLASDETHLTQFGENKIWPLYLFFGNESKYRRCKTSLGLCNHVAYLMRLPDSFKAFVHQHTGSKAASSSLTAHCLREAMHKQLDILLDDEFMDAYVHGVVMTCFDNVDRRFYPRVFTMSADYKDKIIWTGIRNLGSYPCPRCLIPFEEVYKMGTKRDNWWRVKRRREDNSDYKSAMQAARLAIFQKNFALHGKKVDALLKDKSLVPVENTFSKKLSQYGFNVFQAAVVDVLHEVESGNWRSLFIHLLRVVDCAGGPKLLVELDKRYQQVPSFGRDTIRKFRRNSSEMKHLAARDWEDLLQCAIPVFDGLLPAEHSTFNRQLLRVLATYATWHGLAKLRLHTDATLKLLKCCTSELGILLRDFRVKTASHFATRELPKEANARIRRAEAAAKKASQRQQEAANSRVQASGHLDSEPAATSLPQGADKSSKAPGRYERQLKLLNLDTYKFHALGDYVQTIHQYGTTDSYSTEIGESEHRRVKTRYARTNKRDYVKQLTRIERRQALLKKISSQTSTPSVPARKTRKLKRPKSSTLPYWIGESQNNRVHLYQFVQQNAADPAIKNFVRALKSHIFVRSQALFPVTSPDVSPPTSFFFQRDSFYEHRTTQFNYTTYDVRRSQDTVNPNTSHCNVMLLANTDGVQPSTLEGRQPYIYGRVLKIFHVNIVCTGEGTDGNPRRLDVIWVRWYHHLGTDPASQMDLLTFPPIDEVGACDFIDPNDVLRAAHIIPRFSKGLRSPDGAGLSKLAKDNLEWKEYYVNKFVDRDMLMRSYWGMGVGHTYAWPSVSATTPASDSADPEPGVGIRVSVEGASTILDNAEDHESNSSDGDLGLRDRENEDLGSGDDASDAWTDDLEAEADDSDVENELMYSNQLQVLDD